MFHYYFLILYLALAWSYNILILVLINAFYHFQFRFSCRFISLEVPSARKFRTSFYSIAWDESGRKWRGRESRGDREKSSSERYYSSRAVDATISRAAPRASRFLPLWRSSGSTRIENPLSLFLRRDRWIFMPVLRFSTRRKQARLSLPVSRR